MRDFAILVDSSGDLPEDLIKRYGIEVHPMMFSLDGREHAGGYWQEITPHDYYASLSSGGVAKTTQVNPGAYIEEFTKYASRGTDLICITLSSGLSGSYANAENAAREVAENYPGRTVIAIDSLNATGGHGMLAMLAAIKADEGLTASETAAWLNEKKKSLFAHFTVDDLHFLHRGGRLSMLSAVAGSLLSVKPLLNIAPDGTLKLKDKVRGRKSALEMLLTQMKRCVEEGSELDTVLITHCDCEADANRFAEMIKKTYDVKNVRTMQMGPVIGAHTGPGAIAMFFESEMLRAEYEDKYYPQK